MVKLLWEGRVSNTRTPEKGRWCWQKYLYFIKPNMGFVFGMTTGRTMGYVFVFERRRDLKKPLLSFSSTSEQSQNHHHWHKAQMKFIIISSSLGFWTPDCSSCLPRLVDDRLVEVSSSSYSIFGVSPTTTWVFSLHGRQAYDSTTITILVHVIILHILFGIVQDWYPTYNYETIVYFTTWSSHS